jgi:hypothetical protein
VLQLEKKDLRRMPGRIPARIREESGNNIGIIPGNIPDDLQFEKKKAGDDHSCCATGRAEFEI